tara:strand:+ start:463 stop:675 length:213 start_codon:yes stop_codon:yes gene_type:complete
MHLFCEGKKKRHIIEKFEREELFFGEKKRLLKKTQEGEPQTLEKEDQRAKRAKSPSHILERTSSSHHGTI